MHSVTISKLLAFGLLVAAPLASAKPVAVSELSKKSFREIILPIQARHHTPAQIAAKDAATQKAGGTGTTKAAAPAKNGNAGATKKKNNRAANLKANPTKRDIEVIKKRHHTPAQIAAKKNAGAKKKANKRDVVESRDPHHLPADVAEKQRLAAEKANDGKAANAATAEKEAAEAKATKAKEASEAKKKKGTKREVENDKFSEEPSEPGFGVGP
ncbi:hypothetical protein HYFRA_00010575 [Hymenoscyphus fraxineus]|uniref:Uncharacterized protein n=1 Tax=Hymenoscyphus fraxineus TaxID=746836 RepID=A0A9N9PZU9_9HELO|nr:hypothetical protein HYFRA_00010575 [Hymenoscyphus fraxineus]